MRSLHAQCLHHRLAVACLADSSMASFAFRRPERTGAKPAVAGLFPVLGADLQAAANGIRADGRDLGLLLERLTDMAFDQVLGKVRG
ncbi:hypothetical protein GEU84_015145 [Fertoebacter nigrum]|uniref:Uncharacterized protein n=1 Tax=Fertoeibacter niger TaxID=2656921 RepID=A0A8X8H1A3_9RHOB|nr:hypothetical protein [Fertoeibacter niger]NUB45733.1 hypothetical protein [Fertoeibacter niger]